ncbi:uncharacterized protein LOC126841809 [Adelges cooleyi]|uniref:uncharacterized protein LOC126841809 n=1 Tax=Adelges cooleyi TaxID=133065 RepID=UPI0021805802|nr:uncharacterized protein LOC126841809 [Adelges cooleyi]
MLEFGPDDYKDYVFNVRLAKLLGLCQTLHPKNAKYYGYNIYQLSTMFGMVLVGITAAVSGLTGMYHWSNDLTQFSLVYTTCQNLMFLIYKSTAMFKRSDEIWDCLDVIRFDFLSYEFYDKTILKVWQTRTIRITYAICAMSFTATGLWAVGPLFISESYVNLRNRDGSYDSYRLSVFNFYFMVSSDVYNEYFLMFHIVETLIVYTISIIMVLSHVVVISLFYAIAGQLEIINNALENFEKNHINFQAEGNLYFILCFYAYVLCHM